MSNTDVYNPVDDPAPNPKDFNEKYVNGLVDSEKDARTVIILRKSSTKVR